MILQSCMWKSLPSEKEATPGVIKQIVGVHPMLKNHFAQFGQVTSIEGFVVATDGY